jgi:hypothetical protein
MVDEAAADADAGVDELVDLLPPKAFGDSPPIRLKVRDEPSLVPPLRKGGP